MNLNDQNFLENPYDLFAIWFENAKESIAIDPNASILSTSDVTGQSNSRVILIKEYGIELDGFVFYTNYSSRKAKVINSNNKASLLLYWNILYKQIRIEGTIKKISNLKSDEYFKTRPRDSQISAIVSAQSSKLRNKLELEEKFQNFKSLNEGKELKRPVNWGGYILKPHYFEFWQAGNNRLHDRISYSKNISTKNPQWEICRLSP